MPRKHRPDRAGVAAAGTPRPTLTAFCACDPTCTGDSNGVLS